MLENYYSLNSKVDKKSSFNNLSGDDSGLLEVGVYNSGLLTVVDEDVGRRLLMPWESFIGKQAIALAYTAFGEVVYFSDKRSAVHILIPQKNRTNHISVNVIRTLKEWLSIEGVINDVLRLKDFEIVKNNLGELDYGQCYILEPYLVYGGVDSPENYVKGDIEVYLYLVAQAHNHERDSGK